jgi:hypothetical protein
MVENVFIMKSGFLLFFKCYVEFQKILEIGFNQFRLKKGKGENKIKTEMNPGEPFRPSPISGPWPTWNLS